MSPRQRNIAYTLTGCLVAGFTVLLALYLLSLLWRVQ